jgi:hypothetical protein
LLKHLGFKHRHWEERLEYTQGTFKKKVKSPASGFGGTRILLCGRRTLVPARFQKALFA